MKGSGSSRNLAAAYSLTLGGAVVLAAVAANWRHIAEEPLLAVGAFILLALHALPAFSDGHMPAFHLGDLMQIITFRESHLNAVLARLFLLVAVPVLLGTIAIYDEHQYAWLLNIYLLMLAAIGTLEQQQHDGILINIIVTAGFILLASLFAHPGVFVMAAAAGAALMHAVTCYLAMICYPDLDEAASRRLNWLLMRRNLLVVGGAAIISLIGTGILHGAVYLMLWDIIEPGIQRAAATATDEDFGLAAIIRLVAWLAMSGFAVFLGVRMIGAIIRRRRAVQAGLPPSQLSQEANPLFTFRLFGLSRDWDDTRRQIITAYIKTRNGLTRLGYELKISATPEEYLRFVTRRLQHATGELTQLTELFLEARYAHNPPDAARAAEARDLHHRILRIARDEE